MASMKHNFLTGIKDIGTKRHFQAIFAYIIKEALTVITSSMLRGNNY